MEVWAILSSWNTTRKSKLHYRCIFLRASRCTQATNIAELLDLSLITSSIKHYIALSQCCMCKRRRHIHYYTQTQQEENPHHFLVFQCCGRITSTFSGGHLSPSVVHDFISFVHIYKLIWDIQLLKYWPAHFDLYSKIITAFSWFWFNISHSLIKNNYGRMNKL